MYAHKNRRDDRCRIGSARLEIRQILRAAFCGQGCYSSIDVQQPNVILILNDYLVIIRWSLPRMYSTRTDKGVRFMKY